MKFILSVVFAVVYINNVSAQPSATITLQFDNVAGNEDLKLDSGNYTNAAGEQFNIKLLQYFISNIQFNNANGKQYIVPQDSAYFFIREDDSASQYCTVHVPAENYTSLNFIVGIDSLRNTSKIDQRKGVLDPSLTDMYWGWNSGYIFFKMEGVSPAAPAGSLSLHKFRYHIGGFGGYNAATINNIKNIKLDLLNAIILKPGGNASIHIKADILKLFNASTQIKIAEHNAVMFDAYSKTVADNYAQMFSVDDVKE